MRVDILHEMAAEESLRKMCARVVGENDSQEFSQRIIARHESDQRRLSGIVKEMVPELKRISQ